MTDEEVEAAARAICRSRRPCPPTCNNGTTCPHWHDELDAARAAIAAYEAKTRLSIIRDAAVALADFCEKATNVGPITKGPHREAALWRRLRTAIDGFDRFDGTKSGTHATVSDEEMDKRRADMAYRERFMKP